MGYIKPETKIEGSVLRTNLLAGSSSAIDCPCHHEHHGGHHGHHHGGHHGGGYGWGHRGF